MLYEIATFIAVLALVYTRKQVTAWTGSIINCIVGLVKRI